MPSKDNDVTAEAHLPETPEVVANAEFDPELFRQQMVALANQSGPVKMELLSDAGVLQKLADSPTATGYTSNQVMALVRETLEGSTRTDEMYASFEMKQAAKGAKYFDIKVGNIKPEQWADALKLYDMMNEQLTRRALEGE